MAEPYVVEGVIGSGCRDAGEVYVIGHDGNWWWGLNDQGFPDGVRVRITVEVLDGGPGKT